MLAGWIVKANPAKLPRVEPTSTNYNHPTRNGRESPGSICIHFRWVQLINPILSVDVSPPSSASPKNLPKPIRATRGKFKGRNGAVLRYRCHPAERLPHSPPHPLPLFGAWNRKSSLIYIGTGGERKQHTGNDSNKIIYLKVRPITAPSCRGTLLTHTQLRIIGWWWQWWWWGWYPQRSCLGRDTRAPLQKLILKLISTLTSQPKCIERYRLPPSKILPKRNTISSPRERPWLCICVCVWARKRLIKPIFLRSNRAGKLRMATTDHQGRREMERPIKSVFILSLLLPVRPGVPRRGAVIGGIFGRRAEMWSDQ